ncbi:MAG: POTRA domain-containing protein, partial [Terriglobales bacterium]
MSCSAQQFSPAPVIVRSVSVTPPPTRTATAYLPLVAQPINKPLDPEAVRETIRRLFATGEFSDIEAVTTPIPGGVSLEFRSRPNRFLGSVRVTGAPDPPSDSELQDASRLELGQMYVAAHISEAADRIRLRLTRYGFYRSKVVAQETPDAANGQVNVVFQVTPGRLVRLGKVRFTGNTLIPPAELLRLAKLHPGTPLHRMGIQDAVQRWQNYYGRRGLLTSNVTTVAETYRPASDTLDLDFRVDPGPIVTVQTVGLKLSRSVLKKQLPIYQEHAADAELIEEGRRNLQDYLQGEGYFQAAVDYRRSQPHPGQLVIQYLINPGRKEHLSAVRFVGNHYFDNDDLRDHVAVRPQLLALPSFVPGVSGQFSQNLLRQDAAAIGDLYQANGFANVKVTPVLEHDDPKRPYDVQVVYHINEGVQLLVGKVGISGTNALASADLTGLLDTVSGQPYSAANVATDRDSILSRYYDSGFEQARIDSQVTAVPGSAKVDVAFSISEGPERFVNQVFIGGEHHVRRSVIAGQVEVRPGAPLSQGAMLDTQRRLYDLGLFTDAEVTVQNPAGEESAKNVLINVQEAKRYTFNEGVGFQIQSGTGGTRSLPNLLGKTGFSPLLEFDVTRIAVGG